MSDTTFLDVDALTEDYKKDCLKIQINEKEYLLSKIKLNTMLRILAKLEEKKKYLEDIKKGKTKEDVAFLAENEAEQVVIIFQQDNPSFTRKDLTVPPPVISNVLVWFNAKVDEGFLEEELGIALNKSKKNPKKEEGEDQKTLDTSDTV